MKQPPPDSAARLAKMTLAKIYPLLLAKVEKKGRSEAELKEVIRWFTGLEEKRLQQMIEAEVTYGTFIEESEIHPNARLITGVVCGYRVEAIEDPFLRDCRRLDKLIDELAQGKAMEKILRTA